MVTSTGILFLFLAVRTRAMNETLLTSKEQREKLFKEIETVMMKSVYEKDIVDEWYKEVIPSKWGALTALAAKKGKQKAGTIAYHPTKGKCRIQSVTDVNNINNAMVQFYEDDRSTLKDVESVERNDLFKEKKLNEIMNNDNRKFILLFWMIKNLKEPTAKTEAKIKVIATDVAKKSKEHMEAAEQAKTDAKDAQKEATKVHEKIKEAQAAMLETKVEYERLAAELTEKLKADAETVAAAAKKWNETVEENKGEHLEQLQSEVAELKDKVSKTCTEKILAKLNEDYDYNSTEDLKQSVKTLKVIVYVLCGVLGFVLIVILGAVIYVATQSSKPDQQANRPRRNEFRNNGPRPKHKPRQRPQPNGRRFPRRPRRSIDAKRKPRHR